MKEFNKMHTTHVIYTDTSINKNHNLIEGKIQKTVSNSNKFKNLLRKFLSMLCHHYFRIAQSPSRIYRT